jgi:outer membrane receptor protein involved in Fe transport
MLNRVLKGGLCVMLLHAATLARAQDSSTPPPPEPQASQSGAQQPIDQAQEAPSVVPTIPVPQQEPVESVNTSVPDDTKLETVVVTANKRSEALGAVAGAVSALSGDKLGRIGAANFQDIATYLPGVSSASRGAGENEIVVRGVAAGNEGQSVSSTVGVYVDELPVGSSSAFAFGVYALDFSPFDLDRVELLSGPQGTLYGAASLGGLLKYVTKPPDVNVASAILQADGSSTASGGFNNALRGMGNVPWKVLDTPMALRLDGFFERNAGFIDDPSRSHTDVDSSKNIGGRGSLLMDFTSDLSLRLSALYQKITREGASDVDYDATTGEPADGKYEHSTYLDEPFFSRSAQYSAVLKWAGDWGDVVSISGWQRSKLLINFDDTTQFGGQFHTGNAFPYLLIVGDDLDKYTQEVRTNTSWRMLDFQVGGFFTKESANAVAHVIAKATSSQDIPAALAPVISMLPNVALPIPVSTNGDVDILIATLVTGYREAAGFASVTAHLTDRLDLGLGARYAKNWQEFQEIAGGVLGTAPSDTSKHYSSDSTVTFLVNPSYRFGKSQLIYARVASGYRPGGPNFIVPTGMQPQAPTYSPDTVRNYEIGTKMELFHNRAWLNFDIYRIDWNNIQLLVLKNNLNNLENGGRARVLGSELAGTVLVLPGLTVGGNATYSRAQLTEDIPDLQAHSGDPLPLSPRIGAALTTDYRLPLFGCCSGSAGISLRYIGKRPSGFDGSTVRPQFWLPAYTALDLRAGFQWGSLDTELTLKNLLNKVGEISADTSGHSVDSSAPVRVAVTQPRTIGLTVTYRY